MKLILILSMFIGCSYSIKLPRNFQAVLKAMASKQMPAASNSLQTSSSPSSSPFASIFSKLQQQLPATKMQPSAMMSATTTAAPSSGFDPLSLMLLGRAGGGGGKFMGMNMNSPVGLMMMQQMMSKGGKGGRRGRVGGMRGLFRAKMEMRLCEEAEMHRVMCQLCPMEAIKRALPPQLLKCNPFMNFGCCFKDGRSLMIAQGLGARR